MIRYVSSRRKPVGVRAEDEFWPEVRETMDVIVGEDHSVDTGLLDEHGVTIYRVKSRERCGF